VTSPSPARPSAKEEILLADAPPTEGGVRELKAVREIVHAFLTADRPEDVFQFALDRVGPLVGASVACVYLVDGASELMRLAAAYNWPERYSQFLGQMRVRLGSGPSGEAASQRRTIEVPDVFADPTLEDWQKVAQELGFRSLVALPLQTGQGVLGTVAFYFAEAGGASVEMRQLLRMVADQMAATAEKARLIDDLRRANGALQDSNAELERQFVALLEARRLKDEFLANISHELRTPLTAVIGYISLMQEGLAGPVNSDQQETLEQVKDSSEKLLSLIGDLLELTTLKRGGLEPKLTEFDPRDPLRDAVKNATGKADAVSLEVSEPALVETMTGDRGKVTKIVTILLGNAFKFTPNGAVKISVKTTGGRAVYTVEDSGIGIPSEAQQYIFEEFRQVDGTATRKYGGSGLGLALGRRLARLLGGEIVVASTPGVGSTFRLELPVTYAGPKGEPEAPAGSRAGASPRA
jgi:signal transduction histidine kinase